MDSGCTIPYVVAWLVVVIGDRYCVCMLVNDDPKDLCRNFTSELV